MAQKPDELIRFLIDNSKSFSLSDDDCLMVIDNITNTNSYVMIDGKKLSLPMEREGDDEITFMNPFRETTIVFDGTGWYYNILLLMALDRIQSILLMLQEDDHPPEFVKMMSECITAYKDNRNPINKLITKIEEKRPRDIFNIYYKKKEKTAYPRSVIVDDDINELRETYKVTKKSVVAIKMIFDKILGGKEGSMDHFVTSSLSVACPKMESVTSSYRKVFAALNPILATYEEESVIDLNDLDKHIINLEKYSVELNWLTPSSVTQVVSQAKKISSASRSADKGRDTSRSVDNERPLSISEKIALKERELEASRRQYQQPYRTGLRPEDMPGYEEEQRRRLARPSQQDTVSRKEHNDRILGGGSSRYKKQPEREEPRYQDDHYYHETGDARRPSSNDRYSRGRYDQRYDDYPHSYERGFDRRYDHHNDRRRGGGDYYSPSRFNHRQ